MNTPWLRTIIICYAALVVFLPVIMRLIWGRWPRPGVFAAAPILPLLIVTWEWWPDPWRGRFCSWLFPQRFKGLRGSG